MFKIYSVSSVGVLAIVIHISNYGTRQGLNLCTIGLQSHLCSHIAHFNPCMSSHIQSFMKIIKRKNHTYDKLHEKIILRTNYIRCIDNNPIYLS